jgi:branched-chain amino acid transport system substrate-binding protein
LAVLTSDEDQAQIGTDMCQGARGIDLARKRPRSSGWQFEFAALDDQHNPSQAVNIANRFAADPDVMGVIGHFNSSCTKPASAVYDASQLVHVTPGSTNPDLSRQGYATFFRVVATDAVQGPKGAEYTANKLGFKRIFIIDDKTTYGKGLADQFEKRARELGLEILGHEGITQGDKDFTPLLTRIKPLNPDMIYFGGIYPEGALMLRQARGLDMKSVSGDGSMPILADASRNRRSLRDDGGDIAGPAATLSQLMKDGPVGQWTRLL